MMLSLIAVAGLTAPSTTWAEAQKPRNVILFIPDGMRAKKVTPETAPAMAALRDQGVNFSNSHSVFPTFTVPNSTVLSTGHYIGDTGTFGNTIYTGRPIRAAHGASVVYLEDDPVIGDVDSHFGGNSVNEESILTAARKAGLSTAAIGKLGPTAMFDHTGRGGPATIIIDDQTGSPKGFSLPQDIQAAIKAAGLPDAAPDRGDNGRHGNARNAGTTSANVAQQTYFIDVATKVLLPLFKTRNKPFLLVYWSRDPDGTQHNQGDSLNAVVPGINGPTTHAAIRNADDNLARLRQALDALGLAETTNIVVSADHGFSTISKESRTSASAANDYADVPKGFLPPGFLAKDLSRALSMQVFDPLKGSKPVAETEHPSWGSALIGRDAKRPQIVVAANGGSDLIYLPRGDRALAQHIVRALMAQDYISGLFVHDSLGRIAGTLPLSSIALAGGAVTPHPAIVVNFRSYAAGCDEPSACGVVVADTALQQGQGMHGSFSRADTHNFQAAIGPDFKAGYVDTLPTSNADIGMTLARILGLRIAHKGRLVGRVLTEAMPNGATPRATAGSYVSAPGAEGLRTVVNYQRVGAQRYFTAAGFPGRTLGLSYDAQAARASNNK